MFFHHQTQPPGGAVAPGDPGESGGPQGLSLFQHLRQGGGCRFSHGNWHGSLNVPIEHHPTTRYMVYNGYYKVMSNIPKMGHLTNPWLMDWCVLMNWRRSEDMDGYGWILGNYIHKQTPTGFCGIFMEAVICSDGHGETWESMPECDFMRVSTVSIGIVAHVFSQPWWWGSLLSYIETIGPKWFGYPRKRLGIGDGFFDIADTPWWSIRKWGEISRIHLSHLGYLGCLNHAIVASFHARIAADIIGGGII